jgi:hypothetical protein
MAVALVHPATDNGPDTLEKTVAFLQKRDGIDKTLKLLRYAAKLSLVSVLSGSDTPLAMQLRSFESSVGTTRKALKLGKFLADVDKLRKLSTHSHMWVAQLVAAGGEVVYLFLEQVTWLIKAGVLAKRLSPQVSRMSAAAELVGYAGSLAFGAFQLLLLRHQEAALQRRLFRLPQVQGHGVKDAEDERKAEEQQLQQQLAALRFKRMLRTLAVLQDIADAALAANDLRDGKGRLSSPVFLSLLGLLSAGISAHKNWPR